MPCVGLGWVGGSVVCLLACLFVVGGIGLLGG
jgi:hypothetical protein